MSFTFKLAFPPLSPNTWYKFLLLKGATNLGGRLVLYKSELAIFGGFLKERSGSEGSDFFFF